MLLVNNSKSEFLIVGNKQQLDRVNTPVVHAFFTSQVDYYNNVMNGLQENLAKMNGLPEDFTKKLKRVQNTYARLVFIAYGEIELHHFVKNITGLKSSFPFVPNIV